MSVTDPSFTENNGGDDHKARLPDGARGQRQHDAAAGSTLSSTALPVSSPSSSVLLGEIREIRNMIEAQAKPPSRCFWTSGRKKSVSANAASNTETEIRLAGLTERLATTEQVAQQHEQIAKLQETVNKILAGQSQTSVV